MIKISYKYIAWLFIFLLSGVLFSVSAATFEISPAAAQFTRGCTNTIEIYANATAQSSNSADLIVTFDPTRVQVIDSLADQTGTQVLPGNAYQAYVYNQVNNGTGEIRVSALSLNGFLTSRKLFATFDFTTSGNPTTAQFNVYFTGTGDTQDSNIADSSTNLDLLTGVTNGSYTFVGGDCQLDTTPPAVQFTSPTTGATNFPVNGTIQFTITDAGSGIDLTNLSIIINGNIYTIASPEVSYSGNQNSASFSITAPNALLSDQANSLVVVGSDLAGNEFASQNVFNIPAGSTPTDPTTPGGETPGGMCPCEPGTGGVIVLPTADKVLEGTIFENTPVQYIFRDIVTNSGFAGSGAIATGAVLTLSLLPYLAFINAPGLLFNIFSYLLGNRNRKPWGVVVDSVSGQPVAFATARIYIEGSSGFVTQTVSDMEGRYGFALTPGSYRLEVIHDKYLKFQGNISIAEGESTYVYDVRLQPKALLGQTDVGQGVISFGAFRRSLGRLWRAIRPVLFVLGFTLSIASVLLLPSLINIIIFVIYLLITLAYVWQLLNQKPRHASVVDSQTSLRIPGAIIKIFNLNTWEVVDTQVTNPSGLFDYWGKPGEYGILVTARGYTFPSKVQEQSMQFADKGHVKLAKVKLKKGKNALQIYLDPAASSATEGSLGSPFG